MQLKNVETLWENWGVGVDLENCAYLWKNPGYAPDEHFSLFAVWETSLIKIQGSFSSKVGTIL